MISSPDPGMDVAPMAVVGLGGGDLQIERERPVLFVPSHGVPIRGADVTGRLLEVTREA